MNWCLVLFSSVILSYAEAIKTPNWIRPCSRSDSNFNTCALESAKYALPIFIDGTKVICNHPYRLKNNCLYYKQKVSLGNNQPLMLEISDRKIGLPSFNPFRISQVELFGQESFKLKLNNLTVYGLEKVIPISIKSDFITRAFSLKTFVPKIDIVADYEIDGRVLFLPLTGSGPCMLSLVNGTYEYNFHFDLETKNGTEYVQINDALSTYEYDVENVVFKLDNLFNGNKRLGDETNKLLNENWAELNKELKGSILETLLTVYGSLAKKIYQKIPFDELVLP